MALSYLYDYGSSTYQHFNPEMGGGGGFAGLGNDEFVNECSLCFCDGCLNLNTLLDGFNQAEDPCFTQLHPQLPSHQVPQCDDPFTLSPELFQPDEYLDLLHYPKRPRTCTTTTIDYHYLFSPVPNSVNPLTNPVPSPDFFTGFTVAPLPPEFRVPVVSNGSSTGTCTSTTTVKPKKPEVGSLSTQSVAARQRRKKISEKTQELGKLIPGGNKMNTAEMFQAAFNYIKFMEAQLALLQFMETEKDSTNLEVLPVLLCSPKIQEKLCEEGKCIVSKEAVGALARDQRLRSNASASKDLDCFLQSLS